MVDRKNSIFKRMAKLPRAHLAAFAAISVLLLTLFFLMDCGGASPGGNNHPSVDKVQILCSEGSVYRGGALTFDIIVEVSHNAAQDVFWELVEDYEDRNPGTRFDAQDMRLFVANDEERTELTVRAVSVYDSRQYDQIIVQVIDPDFAITEVKVSPNDAGIEQGGSQRFTAEVIGTNVPPQTVVWTLVQTEGGVQIHGETRITGETSMQSVLEISPHQIPGSFAVRAESLVMPQFYGTALVTVTLPEPVIEGIKVWAENDAEYVFKDGSLRFFHEVYGQHNPPQDVTWTLIEEIEDRNPGTFVDSGGLLSAAEDEARTELTVQVRSTVDTSIFNQITVGVRTAGVESVKVTPAAVQLRRGQSQDFTAEVTGIDAPQSVSWTLHQEPGDTEIHRDTIIARGDSPLQGVLAVSHAQAPGSITVRAQSVQLPHDLAVVTILPSHPTGVAITGGPSSIGSGQTALEPFTFFVEGPHYPDQIAEWTIDGPAHPETSISGEGLLTIAPDDPRRSLTVRVTVPGTSHSDHLTVSIMSIVNAITVSPAAVIVNRGQTEQFTAQLEGFGNLTDLYANIEWTITGAVHPGTSISSTGLLTVAPNDNRDRLTVRAIYPAAQGNPARSAHAVVDMPPEMIGVSITSPAGASINRQLGLLQLTAEVDGYGTFDRSVGWHIFISPGQILDPQTHITPNGELAIVASEREDFIYVFAVSTANTSLRSENFRVDVTGDFIAGQWRIVTVGNDHTLATRWDNSLYAWGNGANGRLGVGGTPGTTSYNTPRRVGAESDWVIISAGDAHTMGIRADGSLWAWGNNQNGRLGDSSTTHRTIPVPIDAANTWRFVDAGQEFTHGIRTDGSLWAWGNRANGQLGIGGATFGDVTRPTRVGQDNDWRYVSGGGNHAVAVKTDGTLWAWGSNSHGQLAIAATGTQNIPVQIMPERQWRRAFAAWNFTIAIDSEGRMWGWGVNNLGQLGIPNTGAAERIPPRQIMLEQTWAHVSLASGSGHVVAVDTQGHLWTWGRNWFGELGDGPGSGGTNATRYTPTWIMQEYRFISSNAGGAYSMAIRRDGALFAWGDNRSGQLGTGQTTPGNPPTHTVHNTPVEIFFPDL